MVVIKIKVLIITDEIYSSMFVFFCFSLPANTPVAEHGDAQDQGIKLQFSTGFTVGTQLICLVNNKDGDEILINNSPSIPGFSALSLICRQDQTVPLENAVAELSFNDEVIGTNGVVQHSSLCEVQYFMQLSFVTKMHIFLIFQ